MSVPDQQRPADDLPSVRPAVIPAPVHLEPRPGAFAVRQGVRVVTGTDPAAVAVAVLVAGRIGQVCGCQVAIVEHDAGGPGAMVFELVPEQDLDLPPGLTAELGEEAYRLEVGPDRVGVRATTAAGLTRAAVTLEQLAAPGADGWELAACSVLDHPRFAWRGLSLDVARHFRPLDEVMVLLDLMADLKLNVLHLHLTDDQGWRLDLASRPQLVARSGGTAVGGDPGGWYSAADWSQLCTYAATRQIAVVPEVDVPGHVNAALHALGELCPDGEPTAEYTGIEVGFSRLHAALPATGAFLRDVFGEVATMTPGRWVHLGGDEVLTMGRAEYVELVRAAAGHLAAAGKSVVAWQEAALALPDGGAPGSTVLQYWDVREGAQEVLAAVERGARVLLSPAGRVYLDMKPDASSPLGLEWAGHVEVRDAYDWEPLDVLPGLPAQAVIGVEAALWSETVRSLDDALWLLLPRLAAVAEVAWSPAGRDWPGFAERLAEQPRLWDLDGLPYYRSPQVPWRD